MSSQLVLFSGGLDSTAILYSLVKNGYEVETLEIVNGPELYVFEEKAKMEARARDAIIEWIKAKFENAIITRTKVSGFGTASVDISNLRYAQPLAQVMRAISTIRPYHAGVWLGYQMEEWQGVPHKEVYDLWNAATKMYFVEDNVPLYMPFISIWDTTIPKPTVVGWPDDYGAKAVLFDSLPKDLLKLVWVCEAPIGEDACGRCCACKTIAAAAIRAYGVNGMRSKKHLHRFIPDIRPGRLLEDFEENSDPVLIEEVSNVQ